MLERKPGEAARETVAPMTDRDAEGFCESHDPLGADGLSHGDVESPVSASFGKLPAAESSEDASATKAVAAVRRRLSWQGELLLATMPTAVVLGVLLFVEVLSNQRILFASLASSAFLIYLDPLHATNRVRTLVLAQLLAAGAGYAAFVLLPGAYLSGAAAMVVTISVMVIFDLVHPPAIGTTLAFAFRAQDVSNVTVFVMAVLMTAALVALQKVVTWSMVRLLRRGRQMSLPF